ncbi:hypothetical protein JOF54_002366 [Microlunatus capsulatus]|uniref:DUF222 domain-containing protein n=1 Tax=Microlunatus capsulatus TaxID=99117 RepID=A0ABS4Z8R8_9ACTN|nr:hypothetical protein [Microlunatus capsulatus]MBP2417444.1 hypothetical protein [Microlunatus capsulatus]
MTIEHESLLRGTGYGTTVDGHAIPTAQLLELAAEAEIIPTVLDRAGAVLTLGRSRRIASRSQTLALAVRDGGCSFPGCDLPPPVVRAPPHHRLGRRRAHRPRQPHAAVPLPPPQRRGARLDLPDGRGPAPGLGPAAARRQDPDPLRNARLSAPRPGRAVSEPGLTLTG